MLSLITNFFKALALYAGAFFSGLMAEKYRDTKQELETERERDKIDAQPSAKKNEILDKMKGGKLCLALLCALLLAGCACHRSDSPQWPIAGPAVAAELEKLPENEYPALWDWLGRVDKFVRKNEV